MFRVTARLPFLFCTPHSACARFYSILFSGILAILATTSVNALGNESAGRITLILSAQSAVYEQIATITEQRFRELCQEHDEDCTKELPFENLIFDGSLRNKRFSPGLKVLLGTKAAKFGFEKFTTDFRLNAMLPMPSSTEQVTNKNKNEINVYIDQPFSRYFDLINLTIPRTGRVGVLVHENNQTIIPRLKQIARSKGVQLRSELVGESRDVGEALSLLLSDIDVLLALPDARIHNSKTISHILTTAYRNNIPVIGFSSAYVKAGATGAIYTSPDDIANQLAEVIFEIVSGQKNIKTPKTASFFSVTFNYEVTRSLGLPTFSTREIKHKISKGDTQ